MYISVALRIPFHDPFVYSVPDDLQRLIQPGVRVVVPFRKKKDWGFVTAVLDEKEKTLFQVRPIIAVVDSKPLLDSFMMDFLLWVSEYYLCSFGEVLQTALPKGLTPKLSSKTDFPEGNFENFGGLRIKISKEKALRLNFIPEKMRSGSKKAAVINLLKKAAGPISKKEISGKIPNVSKTLSELLKLGSIDEFELEDKAPGEYSGETKENRKMTDEQEKAFREIKTHLLNQAYKCFLLFGVTGSGKTEVYLRLSELALRERKSVLLLVPEISLIEQTYKSFFDRFGSFVFISHSGLSPKERATQWLGVQKSEYCILIGTRSAVFCLPKNPALLIVDEEHDSSYKQEETPFYNARDLSVKLAQFKNIPVVLGSATPSIESYRNTQTGKYELLRLTKRTGNACLPEIKIIDMTKEQRSGRFPYLSCELIDQVEKTLSLNKQVILFLNRRGYDTSVICGSCRSALSCENCNFAYTWHKSDSTMLCHVCGLSLLLPDACPFCGATHLRKVGTGIQKVEEHFRLLFPEAEILRLDRDSIDKKNSLSQALEKIRNHKADIVIGTRIICKGHDFPHIGMVGIIKADSSMNIPDIRASERTYHAIAQVSGRGGRTEENPSLTLIQTFNPNHPVIKSAKNNDYVEFFKYELEKRELCHDPPSTRIIRLYISNFNEEACVQSAKSLADYLESGLKNLPIQILGPVEWSIYRINRRYYWIILLKCQSGNFMKKKLKGLFWNGKLNPIVKSSRVSLNVDI